MIVDSGIRPRFKLQLYYFLGVMDWAKKITFSELVLSVKWRMITDSIFQPWHCRCPSQLISLMMEKVSSRCRRSLSIAWGAYQNHS